jgi:hypothetical protein
VVHALKYLVWERRCEPDNVGLIRQLETKSYRPALQLIESLLKELRKLDDKMILTEVHLLESRVNHATKNMPKAKVRSFVCPCCPTTQGLNVMRHLPASVHTVGFDVGENGSGFDLLPAIAPGSIGFSVGDAKHGRSGLQDWVSVGMFGLAAVSGTLSGMHLTWST